jgi:hypothetical protein
MPRWRGGNRLSQRIVRLESLDPTLTAPPIASSNLRSGMSLPDILFLFLCAAVMTFFWLLGRKRFRDSVPEDQRRIVEAVMAAERLRGRDPLGADRMIAEAVAREHDKAEALRVALLDRMHTDAAAADELYELLTDDLALNAQAREEVLSDPNYPNAQHVLDDIARTRREIVDRLSAVATARREHAQWRTSNFPLDHG